MRPERLLSWSDHEIWGLNLLSRRRFFALGAGALLSVPTLARAAGPSGGPPAGLLDRAKAALDRHGSRIPARNTIGLVDFGAPSRTPRFHIVDLANGRSETFLVAHGRGSDPAHSGWLERFSNQPGSAASSAGAYLTGETYEGKHGHSRRLIGLDPENSNAEARAIVIHSAWYVGEDMVRETGKLGRSEGCLAVAPSDLGVVLARLAPGSLIYAGKA